MKIRYVVLGLGVALLGFVSANALIAPEAEALGCRCVPNIAYGASSILTGMGESCAEAEANLTGALYGLGLCGGAFCDDYVEITTACYYNGTGGGWWGIKGRLRYKCEVCIDP